jgi:hypothetical protein
VTENPTVVIFMVTLPHALELGRSVVNTAARRARVGLFAIWQGLGALVRERAIATFFGNVTLYAGYPHAAQRVLVGTAEALYRAEQSPLLARRGLRFTGCCAPGLCRPTEAGAKLQALRRVLSGAGAPIPIMLQSYLQLGADVICGQTVYDADFGDALEIGITIPVSAIEGQRRATFELGASDTLNDPRGCDPNTGLPV